MTTRLGSTVTLMCSVEASPKSVHFWIKQGNGYGEGLFTFISQLLLKEALTFSEITINSPTGRYKLTEESESLYSFKLTLTITGIKETDMGNYTCSARNSYGTVRGTIQLESKSFKYISSFKF